jgi:L-lysine 6-transaminase
MTDAFDNVQDLMGSHVMMDRLDLVLDLEGSNGSWMKDKATGEVFFDGFTGFASLPLGWNHPALTCESARDALAHASVDKPALSDLYVTEMAEFVSAFHEIALPAHFPYSFFVSGGALAVENALKTAFDWKTRLNRSRGISEPGDRILHFRQCFHGRSGYTMSLTDSPDPRKVADYPKFDWPRVENPYIRYPESESNHAETLAAEARCLAQIDGVFERFPHQIAGIIIEPIQGEGGDHHFRAEFLQALRRIADEKDTLLIFDEVQSGMGVTGDWWAHEYAGIHPDVMCFGKKMQVCGIVASKRLDEVDGHVFQTSSRLNSTWGGNLIDMVRSRLVLEAVRDENMLQRVREVGVKLQAGLRELATRYPMIRAVRGRGGFIAFDLPDAETRNALISAAFEERLLVLGCGVHALRLRPHLAFTQEDADVLLARLGAAFARIA